MYDFIRRSAAFGIAAVLVFASVTTVLAQELPTVTTGAFRWARKVGMSSKILIVQAARKASVPRRRRARLAYTPAIKSSITIPQPRARLLRTPLPEGAVARVY